MRQDPRYKIDLCNYKHDSYCQLRPSKPKTFRDMLICKMAMMVIMSNRQYDFCLFWRKVHIKGISPFTEIHSEVPKICARCYAELISKAPYCPHIRSTQS